MQTYLPAMIPTPTDHKTVANTFSSCHPLLRNIESLIRSNKTVVKNFKHQQSASPSKLLSLSLPVKPKMFTKLAKWMEKLCKETLNFSS